MGWKGKSEKTKQAWPQNAQPKMLREPARRRSVVFFCAARTTVEPTCLSGEISLLGPELQKTNVHYYFDVSREKIRRADCVTLGRRALAQLIELAAQEREARPVHAEAQLALLERFDVEPLSDFSAKWANFTGLVLFCIDANFCKEIFVGKLLTRSTRFTCFCTAQTSIFQKLFVKFFRIFWQKFAKIVIFEFFSVIFAQILMKFCRNFADNLENVEIFWIFWILWYLY